MPTPDEGKVGPAVDVQEELADEFASSAEGEAKSDRTTNDAYAITFALLAIDERLHMTSEILRGIANSLEALATQGEIR